MPYFRKEVSLLVQKKTQNEESIKKKRRGESLVQRKDTPIKPDKRRKGRIRIHTSTLVLVRKEGKKKTLAFVIMRLPL